MQLIEIELHEATIIDGIVHIAYTIGDTDVRSMVFAGTMVEYVVENELNWQYIIAPDVLTELDANTYLTENLNDVVKMYLIENLK